jgi:hypothetical protein
MGDNFIYEKFKCGNKKIRFLIEYNKGDSSVSEKEYKLYVDMGGLFLYLMNIETKTYLTD